MAASYIQIEITTACNFRCFYCVGRNMPQQHMQQDIFDAILASLSKERCTVSLQGEGEPTLHPNFLALAKQVVKANKIPYTITNGSNIDPVLIAELFPQIGVSLDTVTPEEANRIGRHDLKRVLSNLDRLLEHMAPDRIIVHTVNYGQPMEQLQTFLQDRGLIRHVIQPLQAKDDYRQRYPGYLKQSGNEPIYHFHCRYLQQPLMRYFDVTGREMPCRYIKDTSRFVTTKDIRISLIQKKVPECCIGCREIVMRQQ